MIKRTTAISAAAVAFAAMSGPATAQNRGFQPGLSFLDLNGDGQIAAEEIANEQERLFLAIDVNADGMISVDEFRRNGRLLLALNVTTFFDMMDVDGNKSLAIEEILQPAARWLGRYDSDADGALSIEEITAARLGTGN